MSEDLDRQQLVVDLLHAHADARPDAPALHWRVGADWQSLDWGGYRARVDAAAAGLAELGVGAGDRVAILAANRRDWHVADLAILSLGAITVPCYPTSSSSQVQYLLDDAGAVVVFVENPEQLAKVLLHWDELDQLRTVVAMEPAEGLDAGGRVRSFDQLVGDGERALEGGTDIAAARAAIGLDDVATLVYTSGTTGPPKGAMITHGNIAATIAAVEAIVPLTSDDRFLSFLPVSHIAERVVSHFGQLASGGQTWFARSLPDVPDDLRECRPTIFFAVPRVWEKFRDAVTHEIAGKPGPVRGLVHQYLELGARHVSDAEPMSTADRLSYRALDETVGRTLRHGMGLDHARVLVSAAAPIHPDLLAWFAAIGMDIAEVWGQTEDCGPATMNPPDAIKRGTVGLPLSGIELRIAADDEIFVRSPTVCAGYWGRPDATAELIDGDGWMATGDLGSIDVDGYLTITGRKKDLIITSSGKNISPSELETRLELEPLLAKVVVIGDARPYLTALLTLDAVAIAEWAEALHKHPDPGALCTDPDVVREVGAIIERVNAEHARIEGIKAWRILPAELSVFTGELTPTLKVKRSVVIERNRDLIEEMYAGS
ncbi:MAG: AMP-dependent synthetase/ligase [Acidimicrobiales bacterium]